MPRTLLCTDCNATFPHKEGETRCPSCGFGRIVDADRCGCVGNQVCDTCNPELMAKYESQDNFPHP